MRSVRRIFKLGHADRSLAAETPSQIQHGPVLPVTLERCWSDSAAEAYWETDLMFTGLVEIRAVVDRLEPEPPGVRLVVRAPAFAGDVAVGASIAINGCCLTAVDVDGELLGFDAGAETLSRTNLGRLTGGSYVNLERSLKVGDRLGGHFVTGHIDAVGRLDRREDDEDWSTFWFRAPAPLMRQMASKGSIAVDGVSLTLVDVEQDRFSVALIPHTLAVTTLGPMQVDDPVNLETDVLAKYVERQLRGDDSPVLGPFSGGEVT